MTDILGVSLPSFFMPIHPHQNLALWIETWVRIQTLSKRHRKSINQFKKQSNEAKNNDSKRN
jgi:serine kinase of HPr protein (carbohydrate metabolism regulator)